MSAQAAAAVPCTPPPEAAWNHRDLSPTPPKGDYQAQRELKFRRLETQSRIVPEASSAWCMKRLVDPAAGFAVVLSGGRASYTGCWRCNYRGCVWCAARHAQRDMERAEAYAAGWVARGSAIALVTPTFRHKAGEAFTATWDAQVRALDSTHHGRPWERFKEKYSLGEYFYGNEVTDGANGWHRHQHRAWEITLPPEVRTRKDRKRYAKEMEREYRTLYLAALKKHGRDALPGRALKLTIAAGSGTAAATAAKYVTKFAAEVMQGFAKSGRKGNRSPWELLDDATDESLSAAQRARARERYREFYYGSRRKHWTYFSEAGAEEEEDGEEQEPEELEEEAGEEALRGSDVQYRMLVHGRRRGWLLALVENEGAAAALAELRRYCDMQRWSKEFVRRKGHDPPARFGEAIAVGYGPSGSDPF